jgi:hypothetical protein
LLFDALSLRELKDRGPLLRVFRKHLVDEDPDLGMSFLRQVFWLRILYKFKDSRQLIVNKWLF